MKPRIFVSSTFYDLKYVREDIANFIKVHDFEAIMFEDGDIGYTPGKTLDDSCYETMKNADMVILIVGGNYGSPATGEKEDGFDEYISVTRREFESAVNEGIPIYVFIESSVYAEYGIYESNIKGIESKKLDIKFKATKSVNVFRFIKEIYSFNTIVISEFKKTSEIKDFLSKQWADMFKAYLKSLKEEKSSKKIYEAISNMQSLIKQMGIMIDGLGKKVIGNENNISFDIILSQQINIQAKEIAEKIAESIKFKIVDSSQDYTKVVYNKIVKIFKGFKESQGTIDLKNRREIIDFIDPILNDEKKIVEFHGASLSLFENWEDYANICDNKELSKKVLEILGTEPYQSKIFGNNVKELDM